MTEQETEPGKTLAADLDIEGTGIHSGVPCRVQLQPAESGGIVFQRPGGTGLVPARWDHADAELSDRRTVITGADGARFEQMEHLMAALAAHGITDVVVTQEGPEVPFLGGGSKEFMEKIRAAGIRENGNRVKPLVIDRILTLEDGEAVLVATPNDTLRLSVGVEFPGTIVGSAAFTLEITAESFEKEAAPARTFALAGDIEKLRQAGLAKGGNLENAVVFDHEKYFNEGLHFPDEVVRHKIIDLLGDLALLNRPLRGHFWAWRAGHRNHVKFAHLIAEEYDLRK
ncbi:MAG: UDP-3-O-[3-hydroxymyristoyl] N-acetylglucosamine deacetylase [Candidatus Sumerlaeia bacterium]|nr:UDP-3-O-[3-hydroxymyristoyl] N-acetylglucosamine deacetylase [Candidatus Sumerlaeia bacterium]